MDAHYIHVIVAELCLPWGLTREDTTNTLGLGHVEIGQGTLLCDMGLKTYSCK